MQFTIPIQDYTPNFEPEADISRYTEDDAASRPATLAVEVESEPAISIVAKAEERTEQNEHNENGDQHSFGGEQDVDDDIDFNLGNSNSNGYDAPVSHDAHGPGIKEDG